MVKVIAHRGFSGRYPENTLEAFGRAAEIGTDEIEFDVKITKDGELAILHDMTVDRTTDGSGNLMDMTLSEVRLLDAGSWLDPGYSGLQIPTFSEALSVIPDLMELNIHAYPDPRVTEGLISELIEKDRVENSYIAIQEGQVKLARELCPEMRLCNMTSSRNPDYLETTVRLGCQIMQFPHENLTKELVERAHSHSIVVNVFYANDEPEMERFISYGVDAILTDYPDRLLDLLKRLKA